MNSIAAVEREVLTRYIQNRWTRTAMADYSQGFVVPDPGHDIDEVCPIIWAGQPFDPSKPADLAVLSGYAVNQLRGYGYYTLSIQDGTWAGQDLPLNLSSNQWYLETDDGPVLVTASDSVEDGATVTFTTSDAEEFTATVAASYLHGVGFVVLMLTEIGNEQIVLGSNPGYEARTVLRVLIAAPPANSPRLPDQYAGALAMLFRRVKLKGDGAAVSGTAERDMADCGIQYIWQSSRESVTERPSMIGERDGWSWYSWEVQLRRLYRAAAAGLQTV